MTCSELALARAGEEIAELREALLDWSNCYHCPATYFNGQLPRLITNTDLILNKDPRP